MADINQILENRTIEPPNRIKQMQIMNLTNDVSEISVVMTSVSNVTQSRRKSSVKRVRDLARKSPWAKDKARA